MNKVNKILHILFLIGLNPTISTAQEWQVKEMHADISDLSASIEQRLDSKQTPCALIKVRVVANEVSFSGNVVGDVGRNESEYWIYMPENSSSLKINFAKDASINVNFCDYIESNLKSNVTYILIIENNTLQLQLEEYYQTAMKYLKGADGHPIDPVIAYSWLEKAANQGHVEAQFSLGELCGGRIRIGNGKKAKITLAEDTKEMSIYWYQKAANQGHPWAQRELFWICHRKNDSIQAKHWLSKCEKYLPDSDHWKLALDALNSNQQEEAAMRFYKYYQDSGKRAFEIASQYEGKGIQEEACKWFQKSAEHENMGGLRKMAQYYYNGIVVSKDDNKVIGLLEKAVKKGSDNAKYDLYVFYVRKNDEKKAHYWWEKIPKKQRTSVRFNGSVLTKLVY